MASYLNIEIKCPRCGYKDKIIDHGKVRVDGIDPLMEKYECQHETRIFGEGEKWLTIIAVEKCGTIFYVCPRKPLTVSQKRKLCKQGVKNDDK